MISKQDAAEATTESGRAVRDSIAARDSIVARSTKSSFNLTQVSFFALAQFDCEILHSGLGGRDCQL